MSERDDDLQRVAADLAKTLDALREELEAERRGPPRVVDLLQFTERYTIPAIIAVLEANIRVLELFAGSIRVATRNDSGSDRRASAANAASGTLDALDGALRDATRALSGGDPSNPEARELLDEARGLRAELDHQLDRQIGSRDDPEDASKAEPDDDPVSIDVDSELEGIREEVEEERRAVDRLDDRLDDEDGGESD